MTPAARELVRQSWTAMAGRTDALAWAFYAEIFDRAPARAALLFQHIPMEQQRARFIEMLRHIVHHLDDAPSFPTVLVPLAERHVGYGVLSGDYLLAGESLIRALQIVLADTFTPETRVAWEDAYRAVTAVMLPVHLEAEGGEG